MKNHKLKKALLKDSFKEIKVSYKRFISILLMALLGVGFFAGLRATSPDMVNTIDKYFKDQNVYDIEVLSTLGLTNGDLEAIKNIENVEQVYGTYSKDSLIKINDKEIVTKILCLEEVNKPVIIEGREAQNKAECLVEEGFLKNTNKKIGDKIQVELENTDDELEENQEFLKEKELTIVGTARSPLYISRERGTSKLGSGSINYYIYISKENVSSEVFTEAYVKLKDSEKYKTSTNRYEKYVEETKDNIENIKEERQKARYDELIGEANSKIAEAEEKFNSEKQNGENQIKDAENKIQNGKDEITKGENEIANNDAKAKKEFANAEQQIKNAKNTIKNNETQYENKKVEAEKGFKEAETQKQNLQATLTTLKNSLNELNNKYNEIIKNLQNPNLPEAKKQILEKAKVQLEKQKSQLETNQKTVEAGINKINTEITKGKQELNNAKLQIESAKKTLSQKEKQLTSARLQTKLELEKARNKIEESKKEIQKAEEELQKSREEFDTKIKEAEGELIDAKEKVAKIENPTWYILDRNQNVGYASFIQDTESIENLSMVFPIVFFAIAILVSLTSMTRMVEEERQEIGTLKALGYNKFYISLKYIIYSSLACIVGAIIGMNIGFQILPRIIWEMYRMMYTMPDINVLYNYEYSSLGLALIYVCIVGATLYAILKELKDTPATLLRPKTPKLGKRVLLERITPIWKRLNFSQKVTIRNIFRYKKRFLMTIIGIFGCTSLILAGFGLKDSISKILPYQYGKVFDYDIQITLKSALEEDKKNNFITNLRNNEKVNDLVETYMLSGTANKDEKQQDIKIIVPKESEELEKVIKLRNLEEEKINLNKEGVVITDKLAQLINAKIGDTIKVKDSNEVEKELKITDITENYIAHYIYISKDLYETLYQEKYDTNVLLMQDKDLSEEEEKNLSKELVKQNEVSTVGLTSTMMKTLDDTMGSLNYVVIILIVSAGLLAFVVLYNLSNVNISERIRELATIKVLGFYDKEVYDYVNRETTLLTIIGIILGLGGGYLLNFYIIGTCEIDLLRFVKVIDPLSYLYAILITVAFTIIVNIFTYFALKKIDMIGSLKSVE